MLFLVALAVAAIVNVVRSDGEPATLAPGPQRTNATAPDTVETTPDETVTEGELPALLPLPGELREEGGILWWSDEGCTAGSVELASGAVAALPDEHCRLWPAPDGSRAIALAANRADGLEGRGLVLLEGRAGEGRVLRHEPGFLASELSWAPDSLAFAGCFAAAEGAVLDVRPLDGAGLHGAGLCFPAWVDEGLAAAKLNPLSIELGGETVLGPEAIAELLPDVPEGARREVSALGGGSDRLAVSLVVLSEKQVFPSAGVLAVLSEDGSLGRPVDLPERALPTAIAVAPGGDALWYLDAAEGRVRVVLLPGGEPVSSFPRARLAAWSPSGRYVAAATDEGIAVLAWPGLSPVTVVPVVANDVSWTRSSS